MKLCMIGTGYVGLVSGVCFSDLGNDVICVDKDQDKINYLQKGIIPIYEPGLEELVLKNYENKKLRFSTNLENSIKKSDIVFICVGTPTKKNGIGADLSQIYSVSKEISKSIKKFKIIINKSTVPVTTGDEIEKIISKKVNKKFFSVVSIYLPSSSFLSEKPMAWTTKSILPQIFSISLKVLSTLTESETSHSNTFEEFNSFAKGTILFSIASP